MDGIVKTINKEKMFGFIRAEGNEYFFHRSDLLDAEQWKDIVANVSQKLAVNVSFDSTKTPKGLRARAVEVL